MNLWRILSYIITLLIFSSTIIVFYNFKILEKREKYLAYFLAFSFIIQLSSVLMAVNNVHNLWLLPAYTFGEYVFFHFYLHESTVFKNSKRKKASIALFFIMSVLLLKDLFYINPTSINNTTIGIKAFVLAIWVIIILIQELKETSLHQNNQEQFAYSTLNFGVLFYFSLQFIVFLLGNYILYVLKESQSQLIWILNASINFIFYTILLFGLWKLISIRKS